jgi:hypothetical protein
MGTRHLIQCHCVLPQYRKMEDPIFHKFIVYSRVDEKDDIIEKISACNNCGVLHRIFDYCRSEVLSGIDDANIVTSISDIKKNIPEELTEILYNHECDISVWENAWDIVENKLWQSSVVLAKKQIGDNIQIKTCTVHDIEKFIINTHFEKNVITG